MQTIIHLFTCLLIICMPLTTTSSMMLVCIPPCVIMFASVVMRLPHLSRLTLSQPSWPGMTWLPLPKLVSPSFLYTTPKKKKKNCSLISVGSGKTAAFLIPVLSQLMGKAKKLSAPRHRVPSTYNPAIHATSAEPLVLVVAPTRELCIQIFDECRRLCYRSMLRPCVVYGGAASQEQREDLQRGCDVLIGTPGRLIDFMERPNILSLRRVKWAFPLSPYI